MVPVFTIFNDDEYQSVNYDSIDPYAKYLKERGMDAVLVHGTTGEGTSLTCVERKICIEKWSEACKRYELKLMVQVSGTCFNEAVQLAYYAEQWGADALLLLPELYFKPKNIEELVHYLKEIAKTVPEMPIFYYHIPMLTGLLFSMPDFMDLAEKEIPNFQGIKYTSDNLDLLPVAAAKKGNRSVFIGSDVKCLEAQRRGFESFIMTTLNMRPELSLKIQSNCRSVEAEQSQEALTQYVTNALEEGGSNWVVAMKKQFNKCGLPFQVGVPRKPL